MKTIGLMSGTSCDGVDAVLLELEDVKTRHTPVLLGHRHVPFPAELQEELRSPEALTVKRLAELNFILPQFYARAVRGLDLWQEAEVCGMHGQTVWHSPPSARPPVACTLQIGSTSALSVDLGIPVVGDLRSADVARGGEGAPLVSFAHWFFSAGSKSPRLIVNLGGIANYTYVTDALETVTASDLGPGMMITDALARHVSGGELPYDRDGRLGAGGAAEPQMVEYILSHPFFSRKHPRTTGREDFGLAYIRELMLRFGHLPGASLITSSLYATATAIYNMVNDVHRDVEEVVLTGGGALHPRMRQMVAELVAPITVTVPSDGVLAPAHHEASAVALFAARTLHRQPSSLTGVTGAKSASLLGHVVWPS